VCFFTTVSSFFFEHFELHALCFCSAVLYAAETEDSKPLICRRMEKIRWLVILGSVNEDTQILNSILQRKHQWTGQVLKHNHLLYEITEGLKKGKPTKWRRIGNLGSSVFGR